MTFFSRAEANFSLIVMIYDGITFIKGMNLKSGPGFSLNKPEKKISQEPSNDSELHLLKAKGRIKFPLSCEKGLALIPQEDNLNFEPISRST